MKSRYIMPLKRRRLKKTDYRKRLALVKSGMPRAVIRKSIKNMLVDIAEYETKGDRIIAHASTVELKKFGWESPTGNTPSAYLAGYLVGLKAKKKGVKKVIVDLGRQKVVKGGKLMASVQGLVDSGIKVPVDKKFLPHKDRLAGKHLKTIKENAIEQVKKAMEESL
ncbi:MAG: 50S ribosomal protein L18 [Candidatus Thermoplasmatota archaeon]|jgi:large subunit ribosomal protein L18|nr:50S ribosomal protein L18 [Candidatus Thermoplasmatota archaeon]MCL5790226.1 50S ribosomal protein L18 [Candidatus Thermoplasmatota archaeon]